MGAADTMTDSLLDHLSNRLAAAPIVPLIGDDDAARAVKTARALSEGGLRVVEVVLRSPGAQKGMEAILSETKGMLIGAGTVLTLEQAKSVIASGAQFIVCPGLVDEIVEYCIAEGVPIYPGTMTAGEVQRAYAMGLRTVKFFPASLAGGVPMLKAFSSVFGEMRFMPTGGVSASNLSDFLALPSVIACGGSWLTPVDALESEDYARITALAEEAVRIAEQVR